MEFWVIQNIQLKKKEFYINFEKIISKPWHEAPEGCPKWEGTVTVYFFLLPQPAL